MHERRFGDIVEEDDVVWREEAQRTKPVVWEAFVKACNRFGVRRTIRQWEFFEAGFTAGGQS